MKTKPLESAHEVSDVRLSVYEMCSPRRDRANVSADCAD